jgi:hypothetical protein
MSRPLSVCSVTIGGTAPVGQVPGVGGSTYYFRSGSYYKEIATESGVTVYAKKDFGYDEPLITIASLERAGKVIRLVAPYTVAADGTGKTKYLELVIDRGKLSTIEAKNSLKGKAIKVLDKAGNETTVGYFSNNAYQKRRSTIII